MAFHFWPLWDQGLNSEFEAEERRVLTGASQRSNCFAGTTNDPHMLLCTIDKSFEISQSGQHIHSLSIVDVADPVCDVIEE